MATLRGSFVIKDLGNKEIKFSKEESNPRPI